jgi:hypothetical protein
MFLLTPPNLKTLGKFIFFESILKINYFLSFRVLLQICQHKNFIEDSIYTN